MKKHSVKGQSWYPYAAAGCIVVAVYMLFSYLPVIWGALGTFVGYFKPLILGCVIAYMVNPLARLLGRTVFRLIKKEKVQRLLSNALAFVLVLLFLAFALVLLIPQLIDSVETFAGNLNGYVSSLTRLIENLGISNPLLESFIDSSENLVSLGASLLEKNMDRIVDMLQNNMGSIVTVTVDAGRGVFQWVVAFILSVYLLGERERLKAGAMRLFRAIFGETRSEWVFTYLRRCDVIFSRYIVFNLIDALIIGASNAIFMSIARMEYVGLVSFVVAITNLIPTFGPVIGAVIGGFILLMVKPMHALIFVIFTLLLQTLDGYVIKPKLFGNSMGVSGLWILVAILVFGSMFGVVGILLAIPIVGILDYTYDEYLLPYLERRQKADGAEAAADSDKEEEQ